KARDGDRKIVTLDYTCHVRGATPADGSTVGGRASGCERSSSTFQCPSSRSLLQRIWQLVGTNAKWCDVRIMFAIGGEAALSRSAGLPDVLRCACPADRAALWHANLHPLKNLSAGQR